MRRPWKKRAGDGGTAVADPAGADLPSLLAEIEAETLANRADPDPGREARILRLRHLAGLQRLHTTSGDASFVDATGTELPETTTVPEVQAADLTPEILRAAILRDGCLLVRGLVPREGALSLAAGIDTAFAERERVIHGETDTTEFYAEFKPEPPNQDVMVRDWIRMGGGVLAADSPRLTFQMLELFRAAGVPQLVEGYLGEPGMLTLEKTTLRKAEPTVNGAWHQDGKFLGQVNAVNLWLSLSRCGDEAPGLDIVPRRLDDLVTVTTDEAVLDYQVSQAGAEAAAGPKGIVRPIFEPGDALLFDELMLHQTASDPSMPNPRYAVESWFFGASAFPEYVPIAV
ncbi:MAG: hypothetical protein JWP18_1400 [Solirubrobacterales bacterium]|nr:hypothetical protein [Solirubrobacterales bacterium]